MHSFGFHFALLGYLILIQSNVCLRCRTHCFRQWQNTLFNCYFYWLATCYDEKRTSLLPYHNIVIILIQTLKTQEEKNKKVIYNKWLWHDVEMYENFTIIKFIIKSFFVQTKRTEDIKAEWRVTSLRWIKNAVLSLYITLCFNKEISCIVSN